MAENRVTLGQVNAPFLNVFSSTESRSHSLCKIEKGMELPINKVSSDGKWYQISLKNIKNCKKKYGWVPTYPYFTPVKETADAYVVNSPQGLEVRSGPQKDDKVLCKLQNYDPIDIVGPSKESEDILIVKLRYHNECLKSKYKEDYAQDINEELVKKKASSETKTREEVIDGNTSIDKTKNISIEDIEQIKATDKTKATQKTTDIDIHSSIGYVPKDQVMEMEPIVPSDEELEKEEFTEAQGPCLDCAKSKIIKEAIDSKKLSLEAAIKSYSSSDQVKNMIHYAMRKKKRASAGVCYMFVKNALLASGLTAKRSGERRAKNAGSSLKAEAYINLMDEPDWKNRIKSPYDAPKGAILVYNGGPSGHIEIKTGDIGEGGFVSDYYSPNARTGISKNKNVGRGRRLIGVYIKPGVQS
ncbi:MAG: hypothetical protein H6625_11215 [Bdellovibrionaceae bacterium]|nr:hypothetical protein [Pseudobdellovibrionaceae bacterium]